MIISPFRRKILKIIAYFLGSIVVLLTAFHFWFINHAEQLLEELVESRSNGKLKLDVKKFKFNWFSYDMELRGAVFYSADSNTASTSYRFGVEKMSVRVREILPLVFEKKILIDSLHLLNPDVQVTRLRSKDTDSVQDKNVSLPQEMGKVYNSIQDALNLLKVSHFQIDNGKFTLINKIQPDDLPVAITNIYFHLDNLQVDTTELTGTQKILFSDNVSLQTHNQHILFPDGRHSLSFSNFRINILKKIVEFDSCTIAATKGDSAKSSFSIFFDKLRMTNIDFDTLYQKEVIKADSVYCINPQFKLDVELEKRTGPRKTPPKLNELIQQLTGDLQLEFVVVSNGSFNITTLRDGNPGSFTSDNNNFELQGLRIEKDAPRPLTVKSFAMAIRNYENFLRDSTYAMQFDSILFINNSIYLSNFSFNQLYNNKIINSFSMPQFELQGLSWDDLVFERKLTAEKATLYHPVINYTVLENNKNKKQDVFQTLSGIGDIIQLNNLDISDGEINVHFRGGAQLQLENANMSLLSQNLVQSNRISNLQSSLRKLSFRKGSLKLNNLVARMEDVDFTGNDGKLTAGTVYVNTTEKDLTIDAKKVVVNNMMIDNNSYITEINGMQWQEADVHITSLPANNNISPGFILRNIQGANTKLTAFSGKNKLTAFLQTISADEFLPQSKNNLRIINLKTNGKDLSFTDDTLQLTINRFLFADKQNSGFYDFKFENNSTTDSILVIVPVINFSADLNSVINGSVVADNVNLLEPVISLKRFQTQNIAGDKENKLPEVSIGKLTMQQPEFYLTQPGDKGLTKIEWHGKAEKNNSFELTNFKINNNSESAISADQLQFSLNNFALASGDKTFTTGKGMVNAKISDLFLQSTETDQWDWQGTITDLHVKNFLLDSLGKQAGRLEIASARLNDLTVRSASVLNFWQLIKENTAFRLKEITGQYNDSKNHFDWFNANYDKHTKTFSVDSFTYHPAPGKDSFIASHDYQKDYTTVRMGPVSVGPFDIDTYINDTILNAGTVNIGNAFITSFRDKRMPFKGGIIKPLPVNLIRKIPVNLSIDTVSFSNANIEYAEINDKTNTAGTITVNRINAKIFPVNNYNFRDNDSLQIEAKAWLMDSAAIRLNVKESYTDSLAGFLMTASISPADARLLNPILVPLASVKLESGFLDTLYMRVVGKEYIATGEMKMIYHDLKIKLLNNKKEKKKGFASFFVNTFIIKNKNLSRTSTIFFERLRERSSLNYLVKITLSGVSSSIGLKNNKKLVRKYKKRTP